MSNNLGVSNIYENEIYFANNTFIVLGGEKKIMFTALDNPNFMITTDENLINKCSQWIEGMKSHSTSLTSNKELFRKNFFDKITDRIDSFDDIV